MTRVLESRAARFALATVALVFMAAPTVLSAQGVTTAGVAGRVVDAAGAPVAGARIEFLHTLTGASHAALSDADGRFSLANLRPGGPYTLEATRIGMQRVTREDLTLSAGQRLRLEIELSEEAVPLPELSVRVETDPEFDPARMGRRRSSTRRRSRTCPRSHGTSRRSPSCRRS